MIRRKEVLLPLMQSHFILGDAVPDAIMLP